VKPTLKGKIQKPHRPGRFMDTENMELDPIEGHLAANFNEKFEGDT
jgi:hypothetical protein